MGHDIGSAAEGIASLLGESVTGRYGRKVEPLIPTTQAAANAKSLSVVHGLGSFPMHTDGAHRLQPPRFVVLVCARSSIIFRPDSSGRASLSHLGCVGSNR